MKINNINKNNKSSFRCRLCNSEHTKNVKFLGVDCIYTNNLSKPAEFNFCICEHCCYVLNLDYPLNDFAKLDYDNFTVALKADKRELIYSKFIADYIEENYYPKDKITFVEFGSGYRLGLLSELSRRFPKSQFFAIDPIFKNRISDKEINHMINTIDSIEKIELKKNFKTVLIARNSLEYVSPEEFRNLIAKFFKNGGLFWSELTTINIDKWGSSFFYSECLNFYPKKTLNKLFYLENLYMNNIFENFVYGDCRNIIFSEVLTKKNRNKIRDFNSLDQLSEYCQRNKNNSYVMWGLGGRNMMALMNELKFVVNKIVDSDKKRVGVNVPFIGNVSTIECIHSDEIIICLNNRFVHEIRKKYPNNEILLVFY